MMEIGRVAVAVVVLAGAAAAVSGWRGSSLARRFLGIAAGGGAVATALLARALLTNDFTLVYVADHSRRGASGPYRLAALWGGMAGSLLWFSTLLALVGWLAAGRVRTSGHDPRIAALVAGVPGGLVATLGGLVLAFADPFRRLDMPQLDGIGLTPILEHPAMLYHPPLLYLGLSSLIAPFALTMAALAAPVPAAARTDALALARRWLMGPWVLLAIGMVAGAHWAYVELGWGGYWAWDPVENTALLPFLAVTLAVHAALRGVGRGFAVLVSLAFLLALTGTMLTRSGAVPSVHAFGESVAIGRSLAAIVVATAAATAWVLWRSWAAGAPDSSKVLRPIRSENLRRLLAGHTIVVGTILAVTFVGTVAPLWSDLTGGDGLAIEGQYFTQFAGPLATLGLALVTLVPTLVPLRSGRSDGADTDLDGATRRLDQTGPIGDETRRSSTSHGEPWASGFDGQMRGERQPARLDTDTPPPGRIVGFRVLGGPAVPGPQQWLPGLIGMVLGAVALVVGGGDLDAPRLLLGATAGAALVSAGAGGIRARRGGGRLAGHAAHAGLGLLLLGVAGTATGTTETVAVRPGDTAEILGQTVRYGGVQVEDTDGHGSVAADIRVDGQSLEPRLVAYPERRTLLAESSLVSGPLRDVQVTLRDAQDDGTAVLQVGVHPLQVWVWWGALALVAAGILSAWEHRAAQHRSDERRGPRAHEEAGQESEPTAQLVGVTQP